MKINYFISALFFIGIFASCGTEDEPTPIPLIANITNPAQTVAPFTEVTLDGSTSTGPEGFSYEWIYHGSETITLSSTTDAIVTFTPEKNTQYSFTLRLTLNGEFAETQSIITVTGAVILDASSFTSDRLSLYNIDDDPSNPDYLIQSDFTIPTGKTLIVENAESVTIGVDDAAGMIVNGRMEFGGSSNVTIQANTSSWKGILIDAGVFDDNASQFIIDKAGDATFGGQSDAAVITIINEGNISGSGGNISVTNTLSDYGIVFDATAGYNQTLPTIIMDGVKVPLKAPINLHSNAISNIFPTSYEYIHLTTPGAGTTVGSIDGTFTFSGKDYFIDGDFTAGSPIVMNSGTIYMKEGAGIVGGEVSLNTVTIKGMDDASWKGIAGSVTAYITSSSVIGAGSATHDTGSFSTTVKAAIYASLLTRVNSSTISGSGGYGVYIDSQNTNNAVLSSTFTDITNSDVSVPYYVVGTTIQEGNTWSSNTPVELRSGQQAAGSTWKSLGTGFAYLATSNIVITGGSLVLDPGVHIKFQSGFGMDVHTTLIADGTVTEPIILDGEGTTAGSWNGLQLQGQYRMQFCTINNGGQAAPIGYTDTANVYFGSGSSISTYPQTNNSFENCTLSNSGGYGAAIKLGKYDPVTASTTNTYTTNASGDIKLP